MTELKVNDKIYLIDVYHNGWVWCAYEENYDGPEDHYRSASGKTKEECIERLSEKLEELEELNQNKP